MRTAFNIKGDVYFLEVEKEDTVFEVKCQVFSIIGLCPEEMELFFMKVLDDDQTIRDCGLEDGSEVEVRVSSESIDTSYCCSKILFGEDKVEQVHEIVDGKAICLVCAEVCQQMVQRQRPSMEKRQKVSCQCQDISESCLFSERVVSDYALVSEHQKKKARIHFGSEYQRLLDAHSAKMMRSLSGTIQTYKRQILQYENPEFQSKALNCIPFRRDESDDEATLKKLLHWFKHEFFSWMDQPQCEKCDQKSTLKGMANPTPEEQMYFAGRVELYQCPICQAMIKFPRYNHAAKLLETRTGRCGEWAQCFALCCRALGFETRLVIDLTDHVWVEVYCDGRWRHLDSCENAFDTPLLYEKGWGKKVNYILAFSVNEVRDVTKRYTRDWEKVMERRTCPEIRLKEIIDVVNQQFFRNMSESTRIRTEIRWKAEKVELDKFGCFDEVKEEELKGRITGDVEWRKARGEMGSRHEDMKNLIKKYFLQITKGCGKKDCAFSECKSSSLNVVALEKTKALDKAIRLAILYQGNHLCN